MTDPHADTPRDDAPPTAAKFRDARKVPVEHVSAVWAEVLVGRSVTINRSRADLYAFWREFANLPRFMHNIQEVTVIDDVRSRWVVAAPAGKSVAWQSSITAERPGELIAWESDEGASIRNSGKVEFKDSPEGRGTVVTLTLAYDPPAGRTGQLIAKLFHKEPKIQARRDLRRFKQLMETGEVSTTTPPDAAPRL
jgi:uncharacterized membrane protein